MDDNIEVTQEDILNFIHQNKRDNNTREENKKIISLDEEAQKNLGLVKSLELPGEVRHVTNYETSLHFYDKDYDSYDTVSISDRDKELFLRAILLDRPLVLPIHIKDDIDIDIRYLSEDSIYNVDGFCADNNLGENEAKKFYAFLMLDKFSVNKVEKNLKDPLEKLYEQCKEFFKDISDIRLDIIFKALNIFEIKMIKLFKAFDSEDF